MATAPACRRAVQLRLATLLVFLLVAAAPLEANDPAVAEEDISVSILSVDDAAFPEVTLVFTADQHSRPIAEVAPRNVEIEESGSPATPVSVRRAVDEDIPLALIVALDVSGSMEGEALTNAKSAATTLINSLAPTDSAAVLAFANEVTVEQALTQDKALLTDAVSRLQAGGNTALYDAVAESALVASDSNVTRRAVVLLSDGEDFGNLSALDREQSLTTAAEGATLFYSLGVGPYIDQAYLEELASRSGGRFFLATGPQDIPAVYASVEELLRSQFVVAFQASSPSDLQERSVKISLTLGESTGFAERAYRSLRPVPPPPPPPPAPAAAQVHDTEPEPASAEGSGSSFPVLAVVAPAVILLIVVGVGARRWLKRRRATGPAPTSVPGLPRVAHGVPDALSNATVVITSGPDEGRSFDIGEQPVTIGSGPTCTIRLSEVPGVAREHARVWWRDGRLMLHHIARGQATSLSGRTVSWAILDEGDDVSIGPYVLRCVRADR